MSRFRLGYCRLRFLLRTGAGYVRNTLANVVKRAIGRAPYYDDDEVVFGAWLKYRLGLGPRPKMTCRGRPCEGAGSQARLTMGAINFARLLGFEYAHTPFHTITHADRPMESWVKAWEVEFNLGAGESRAPENDPDVFDFASLYGVLSHRVGLRNFYAMYGATANDFRRKYYLNSEKRTNPVLTVAVHIRRGDVTESDEPTLWTGLDEIVSTVRAVKAVLDARNAPFRIQVFSEGDAVQFRALADEGAQLFLDKDPIWTFREMVEADVLIMGKGFYSYVAAILSDGVKLCDPWRYPPMKDWIVRTQGGSFDRRAFAKALATSKRV